MTGLIVGEEPDDARRAGQAADVLEALEAAIVALAFTTDPTTRWCLTEAVEQLCAALTVLERRLPEHAAVRARIGGAFGEQK